MSFVGQNVVINKRPKVVRADLHKLSKVELIDKIIQLEAHNKQLKNILDKKLNNGGLSGTKVSNQKKYDFSKAHWRHTLLKFLYFGWDYQGYVCQEDTTATIEHNLFTALQKTCLIESRETSNYHRCGRTDKEVSAFCQVISIDLRSKFSESEQYHEENIKNEIDYCRVLNNVLPTNIRCISWMPLRNKLYSARFDCDQRTYKYFFPKGNLDIEVMRQACSYLVGTHDFRNLCKMDVANGVVNYLRTIIFADIEECRSQIQDSTGYEMYNFKITGQAFLWHQIRCIMAILILVGEKYESPVIISELLDVDKNPCKPQYSLANGQPLNLYYCDFRTKTTQEFEDNLNINTDGSDDDTTEWVYNEENLENVIENLQIEWSKFNIKSTMIREVVLDVSDIYTAHFGAEQIKKQTKVLQQGVKAKQYQKLLSRKRCESLENRLDHYIKKQRLIVNEKDMNSS